MSTTRKSEKIVFALNVKKDSKLYLACFDAVRQHVVYWNKWIQAEGWIDIINDRYDLPTTLKFTSSDLNRAIGRHPRFSCIDIIKESNLDGVYKASYFETTLGKKLIAYYITSLNVLP